VLADIHFGRRVPGDGQHIRFSYAASPEAIREGVARLDAFVRRDAPTARRLVRRDDEVDGLNRQVFRELLTYMIEDPTTITRAMELILVARNLERVADLATNVAEEVVFIAEARIIKHHAEESVAGDDFGRS